MPNYDRQVAERDFVRETAEINAHVLELVQMIETDAHKAIDKRDVKGADRNPPRIATASAGCR